MAKQLDYDQVDPDLIHVPHRLRAVVPSKVDQLAESMAAIGLQQPITVWSNAPDHLELVAGAHRLAAAIKLGWAQIDVISADDMDEFDRQIWEIDENLIRAELTPLEHAEHYARRDDLWRARAEKSGKTFPTLTGRGNKAGATEIAEKTGVSKRSVNLAISRARGIPEKVRDKIRGTDLDKGTYLDSIKGMEPNEQRMKVDCDLMDPDNLSVLDVLKRGYFELTPVWRRRFNAYVEKQIIDDGAAMSKETD